MRSVNSFQKIGKLERNQLISGDKGAQSIPNRSNPFQPFPTLSKLERIDRKRKFVSL